MSLCYGIAAIAATKSPRSSGRETCSDQDTADPLKSTLALNAVTKEHTMKQDSHYHRRGMMISRKERFRPKLEYLRKMLARGVIPYTVWNFEGKQKCEGCGRKAVILYPHSCGWRICCDCWHLSSRHPNHFQTKLKV